MSQSLDTELEDIVASNLGEANPPVDALVHNNVSDQAYLKSLPKSLSDERLDNLIEASPTQVRKGTYNKTHYSGVKLT